MSISKQELEQAIAQAISIVYSEEFQFDDAVIEVMTRCAVTGVEAFVALSAAASTKDGGSFSIDECLGNLMKYDNAENDEISLILWAMYENNAKRDFLTVQMANMFMRIESERKDTSFGGAIYKAEKLKCGPLTKEERESFRLRYPSQETN